MEGQRKSKNPLVPSKKQKMSTAADLILNPKDRISRLPEFIIHEILFRLPTSKEIAQTIVLSKTWRRILSTFPILNFDQFYFGQELEWMHSIDQYSEMRDKFLNFVGNTMLRFHEGKLLIKNFKLYITLVDFKKLAPLVDNWIGMAVEREVEELCLNIETQDKTWYSLPQVVFDAKSLKVLELWGCKLEQPMKTSTKFYPLRKLSLNAVHVDEQMIQYLISNCPLIECFTLSHCEGFKTLKVSLKNLKMIRIDRRCGDQLQVVDIYAPNLQLFHWYSDRGSKVQINLGFCKNVTRLEIGGAGIGHRNFHHIISGFPLLQNLCIECCASLERVKISCKNLKELTLVDCKSLVEAVIDAPNLLKFHYGGDIKPLLSSKDGAGQWEAYLTLYSGRHLDTHWFVKLREFLAKSNMFKLLCLSIASDKFPASIVKNRFSVEEVKGDSLSPLHDLDHLALNVDCEPLEYPAILDGLLWSCRPQILSAVMDPMLRYGFIKFLCEKLMRRENPSCCSSSPIKCWRHYLRDVKIESFGGIEDERNQDWEVLLDALSTLQNPKKFAFD